MPQVNTVTGPIDASELGVTAIHEHLLWGLPGWEHHAGIVFDRAAAFEKLKADLLEFKRLGGDAIVDCTGMASGRHAEFAQNLSRATRIRIICCTGMGAEPVIPGYFRSRTAAQVAAVYSGEIMEGMSVLYMRRSGARAGIVRAAVGAESVSEVEEVLLRAAGMAAAGTGVAVCTRPASTFRRQLEILQDEGLPPSRVLLRDAESEPDASRDRELAGRGAYIGYTQPIRNRDLVAWAKMVGGMVQAGFGGRVVVSCTSIGYVLGQPVPPQPTGSVAALLTEIVPALRSAGLSQHEVRTILVENPRRVLGFGP